MAASQESSTEPAVTTGLALSVVAELSVLSSVRVALGDSAPPKSAPSACAAPVTTDELSEEVGNDKVLALVTVANWASVTACSSGGQGNHGTDPSN